MTAEIGKIYALQFYTDKEKKKKCPYLWLTEWNEGGFNNFSICTYPNTPEARTYSVKSASFNSSLQELRHDISALTEEEADYYQYIKQKRGECEREQACISLNEFLQEKHPKISNPLIFN